MCYTLVYNVERHFARMLLTFIFLLYILDELFTLWTTALIEAWIDGEFIGVHQLSHRHTKQ